MDNICKNKCELHIHDVKANKILEHIPCDKMFDKASLTFQLISDPTRLKILWLLSHCELCVNNIAVGINMSAPAVSHHLKLLKQADLIESKREGKEIYYKIASTKEAQLVHQAIDDILDMKCPYIKEN